MTARSARRLGRLARRLLAGVRRHVTVPIAARRRPALSVIVPMYNVERYVGECLRSVLDQDITALEVLVVDDGSTDGSAQIVRRVAARDPRVRLWSQPNAGQGPARNVAIRHARGDYLVFVDSDDRVPPGSFRYLVAALEVSGSDFAVAGVRRLEGDRTYRPSWTVKVHEHDRVGIRIDDFPAAMGDVVAHHRIIRRSFWTERIGDFDHGVYEDHVPMVAAYLRAERFDVLSRVVYDWRLRAEGTSTGQQKHDLANLTQRIAVKATARDLVWREGSPAVQAAWVGRVLDIDFPPYVEKALDADETYRRTLRRALQAHIGLATREAWRHVRVRQKVRTYLAAQGAWDVLATAERVFDTQGSIPPTVIRDGSVALATSPTAGTSVTIPDDLLELAASESRLQVCLADCRADSGGLHIVGWAVIRGVDLSHRRPSIRLSLEHEAAPGRLQLPAVPIEAPEATAWVKWPHGSFDRAGFHATLDPSWLKAMTPGDRSWQVRAVVDVDGVVREGGVHHALLGRPKRSAMLTGCQIRLGSARIAPAFDAERGLCVEVRAR